jgi:hypothetical protein
VSTRTIRRATNQSRLAVADLLATVLVGEVLAPGSRLFVVTPWFSDAPVIDNRGGRFAGLDPGWPSGPVRITAVLRTLLAHGVAVSMACRPEPRETDLLERLREAADRDGTGALLRVRQDGYLEASRAHEKALVADGWALHGSMNLTYHGIEVNGELVTFTTDPNEVSSIAAELMGIFEVPGA